jgi:ATP-dependent DNA ligase
MEKTGDGRLRHPVFLGLRDDKPPRDVRWVAHAR